MRTTIVIVTLLLVILGNGPARAHAFLDHASPLVGSTVPTAPHEVSLSFTQNLEPSFSSRRQMRRRYRPRATTPRRRRKPLRTQGRSTPSMSIGGGAFGCQRSPARLFSTARAIEQHRERQQAADPSAGRQQVERVGG